MFEKLAIWYLRKKKCSVLIGYKATGGQLKALGNHNYTYDNEINNVDYRLKSDNPFNIPEGSFHVQLKK